ncbi:MAG: lytic transglycosylase domain-containing protein, partial [Aquiluna sp.]
MIDAVRQVESGNREGAKSKKGALGPMQVMPETLKNPGYGLKPATDYSEQGLDRFGQEYLQAMIQHYGDVRDALVAYNWGPGNANRWISRGRKDAALPAETRNYLNRVGLDYSRRLKNRDASILEAEEMLSASASPMQERPAPVAAAQEPEAAPAPAP